MSTLTEASGLAAVGKKPGPRWFFWPGVALLSVVCLFWLLLIPIIVSEPDLAGILTLVVLSGFLLVPGVYLTVRGRSSSYVRLSTIAVEGSVRMPGSAQNPASVVPGIEDVSLQSDSTQPEVTGGILTDSSYSASFRDRLTFIWVIFVLTFPLWNPGTASILRRGNIVNIYYSPGNGARSLEEFVDAVARYSARAMDRTLNMKGVERVNVWAMGRVFSAEARPKRAWKLTNLTLAKDGLHFTTGSGLLRRLANTQQAQFFKLCSARWVDMSKRPLWPPLGGSDMVPLVWPWF